jgi:hypothetical protein
LCISEAFRVTECNDEQYEKSDMNSLSAWLVATEHFKELVIKQIKTSAYQHGYVAQ